MICRKPDGCKDRWQVRAWASVVKRVDCPNNVFTPPPWKFMEQPASRRRFSVAGNWEATKSAGRLFHKRGAAQHWRHARQLFWVAFGVRPASETTLTAVVLAIGPRRPTVRIAPSPGIQVLSGCGSGTPERPGGTLCVLGHVASASRAEVARCGRIYDCYTLFLLPHWALTPQQ